MSRQRIRLWLSLGAALAVMAAGSPAAADEAGAPDASPVSVAERRAAEAFQAYSRKEYQAAITLYLQAYDAAPSGSILYNIARIYDLKLQDRAQAVTFYRRYVADPEAQADLVEISNQRLRELRNTDAASPAAAGAARTLDSVSRADHEGVDQQPGGWSTLRWAGVAVGAAGLAGIGIGSGFGLSAMSRANVAKGVCDGNACTSQAGVDAAKTARSQATVSTVGFAAGGALLAAGAVMFFSGGEKTIERQPEVHLEALASPSAASLQVVGRW
jgi:tetratricopeptide (TPR) repeat protein